MSERVLTNAYWMEKGAQEERAKILEQLHQLLSDEVKDVAGDMDTRFVICSGWLKKPASTKPLTTR